MSDERIEADLEKLDGALARWKAWVLARDGWPMSDAERGLLEAMGDSEPGESFVRAADATRRAIARAAGNDE